MPAMTAVYFVNVLRLLIIRVPRVPGANINEVPNSEKFSYSAGGPQLEVRWGPGRAKRARARHTYTKTRKTAKSHLFSELGEMLGNTGFEKKKKNLQIWRKSFLHFLGNWAADRTMNPVPYRLYPKNFCLRRHFSFFAPQKRVR